jgi:DNA-binding transcriptional MerR regulator
MPSDHPHHRPELSPKHSSTATAPHQNRYFGAKDVCQAVGISHRQLDYWVLIGVVTPRLERHGAKQFRRFSQQDVTVLQRIKKLTDEGVVVSRASERVRREMSGERQPPGRKTSDGAEAQDIDAGAEQIADTAERSSNDDV